MADEDQLPPGYVRSRGALRAKFGARSIDAGNRQSSADTTPSGRARNQGDGFDQTPSGRARQMVQRGTVNPSLQKDEEDARWRSTFKQDPQTTYDGMAGGRPFAAFRNRAQPASGALGAIGDARASGATSGTFPVPQYGGSVGFSTVGQSPVAPAISLAPETPEDISSMLDLIGGTPLANSSALGASSMLGRGRYRKSILDSASRWVQPV